MIRRYNYTGRKKVLASRVKIEEAITNGIKSFSVTCDFSDLGFPDNARIYIEPFFKSSFLRFDFGTVARMTHPNNTSIDDLPITDNVRYRIKVVDTGLNHGMILGFADIQGSIAQEGNVGRQSILPVDFRELGRRIWTLDFDINGPVLVVNVSLEGAREKVIADNTFFSLVYPEVIKRVAISIIDKDFDENDVIGWKAEWLRFFKEVLHQTFMPDIENKNSIEEWANEISETFARKYKVIERYTKS